MILSDYGFNVFLNFCDANHLPTKAQNLYLWRVCS